MMWTEFKLSSFQMIDLMFLFPKSCVFHSPTYVGVHADDVNRQKGTEAPAVIFTIDMFY